jgi:microcin C transport system ATP-binding protein
LRRRLQVVFQDPYSSLSPRMTVGDIVSEGLRVHHPQLSASQTHERVLQVLAEVGLTEAEFPGLLTRYPHEFSGGQRQRLAIARALVVEPEVLVLDEPTSALDVSIQKQVLELLQDLQKNRGLSYVLITHDLAVVRAMAHQVMVLHQGRCVEQGPLEEVLQHPKDAYTKALIQA